MVIREVFEVLHNFSRKLSVIPSYSSSFFDQAVPDSTLYPILINNNNNTENSKNFGAKKDGKQPFPDLDSFDIKYSRMFEGLWTHTAPHEPFLILNDTMQLKLREYLEQFPIETYAPPENAIIVIDNKKYKARETLGYFRRGVQLVDYSKDVGGTVVDTVSTMVNVTMTSAVRKIPPGKISKLVHPDLHLENYTNTILQVGSVVDSLSNQAALSRVKGRKRRVKFPANELASKKIKEELNEHIKKEDAAVPLPNDKLQSIASFCDGFQGEASAEHSDALKYLHESDAGKKSFENVMFFGGLHTGNRNISDECKGKDVKNEKKDGFCIPKAESSSQEIHGRCILFLNLSTASTGLCSYFMHQNFMVLSLVIFVGSPRSSKTTVLCFYGPSICFQFCFVLELIFLE